MATSDPAAPNSIAAAATPELRAALARARAAHDPGREPYASMGFDALAAAMDDAQGDLDRWCMLHRFLLDRVGRRG